MLKPPTEKQIATATRFFRDHAKMHANHGFTARHADYRAEMIWIGYNPDCRRDTSRYIGMFIQARRDARMALVGLR
jgi:hypothetical protein